jgi:hypothetical protein
MKFAKRACTSAMALAVMLVLGVGASQSAYGQTYKEKVLYSYTGGADGGSPYGGLIRADR